MSEFDAPAAASHGNGASGASGIGGRTFIALCAGITLASALYVLCDAYKWPRLSYFPYEDTWHWVTHPPNAAPMLYVGTMLWGCLGFVAGLAVAQLFMAITRRVPSHNAQRLWGAWSISAFLLAGVYYWWNLWPIPK